MFRLLTLLGAALFLTMLVGGQDRGQTRAGLQPRPERPLAAHILAPAARAEPAAVTLAVAEVPAVPVAGAAPEPVAAVAEVPVAPAAGEPGLPAFAAALPATDAAPEPALPLRWITAEAVNVRQGPSTGNPVIGRLTRGEAVAVVAEADGWTLIRIEGDGIEGYVASRLLASEAP